MDQPPASVVVPSPFEFRIAPPSLLRLPFQVDDNLKPDIASDRGMPSFLLFCFPYTVVPSACRGTMVIERAIERVAPLLRPSWFWAMGAAVIHKTMNCHNRFCHK